MTGRALDLVWRLAALALVLAGFAVNLGQYPLLDPDEGRNAEIAREMAQSNDYIVPRLDGLPYPDKPVLYFAATAAMMELFGHAEVTVRLPSLLFTLGTLAVVGWFAGRLYGPDGRWIAVIATGATPLTLGFARTVIFDSALTLFVVLALVGFHEAIERRDWQWSTVAWGAIALGVLTKGPIALALPLMVAIPYAFWRRAGPTVWTAAGPLLFLALVLPWVIAMDRRVPGFLHHALVTETLVRLTTDELRRTGPFWYFLPIMLAGTLPWSLAVVTGWQSRPAWRDSAGRPDPGAVFALLWLLIPLVFLTLSQSKRPQYVLPLVPAVGLITARLWHGRPIIPGAAGLASSLVVLGVGIVTAHPVISRLVETTTEVGTAIRPAALGIGVTTMAAGALVWLARSHPPVMLAALSLPLAAIPVAGGRLMKAIGDDRSAAGLARAIAPALDQRSPVVAIQTFPLSLPFYLNRTVLLATGTGDELTSNYLDDAVERWRDYPGSPLRPPEWWREALLECRATVFVTRAGDVEIRRAIAAKLPLLADTRKFAAYGPCLSTNLARRG